MELRHPWMISSRLLPAVKVGDGTISIEYAKRQGNTGRTRYRYFVDIPGAEYSNTDLQSGCQGGSLVDGMCSLLSFLSAAGEAYSYQQRTGRESDNSDLFPVKIMKWCGENQDELSMAECEIEENSDSIQE